MKKFGIREAVYAFSSLALSLFILLLFYEKSSFALSSLPPELGVSSNFLKGDAKLIYSNFAEVKKDFISLYAPIVKKLYNLDLVVRKDEDSPKYLGGASIEDRFFVIGYGADIANDHKPKISSNGFAMTLCHELGHLMGGAPKKIYDNKNSWASSEGQADFFAANVCLKKLYHYKLQQKYGATYQQQSDKQKVNFSIKLFAEEYLQALASIYDLYPGMEKFAERPQLSKADPNEVGETNLAYPSLQCRLDTYKNGVDDLARPRCWFKR